MKTDIQIAQETTLRGVNELATEMGLSPQLCEPFGSYIAKVSLDSIDEQRQKDHHLILVTAISPTKAGIGKTTAERMILELRGKLAPAESAAGLFAPAAADASEDIISTLLALGYNEREARAAVKGIAADVDVSEGVRLALKNLMK